MRKQVEIQIASITTEGQEQDINEEHNRNQRRNDSALFMACAPHSTRLKPSQLKSAYWDSGLLIQLSSKQAKSLCKEFGKNNSLNLEEFMECVGPSYPLQDLMDKFNKVKGSRNLYVTRDQAKQLLQNELEYSAELSQTLLNRCSLKEFNLRHIIKLTSPGILFLDQDRAYTKTEFQPNLRPASWSDVVFAMHVILAGLMTAMLNLFPLKHPDSTPTAPSPFPSPPPPNIPFLSSLSKHKMDHATDTFLTTCLFGWGVLYLVSMRFRGFRTGKVLDCISLLCAFAFLIALVYHLNTGMTLIPLTMCAVGLFFLGCTKNM